MNITRKNYDSDLTDSQWDAIKDMFNHMHVIKYSKRELVNAVLYRDENGCKWRNLPHDFPNWKSVYSFYSRAAKTGLWDKIRETLVSIVRQVEGKNPEPSVFIIDSQSVKTAYAAESVGFDGNKKNQGA